MFGSGMYGAQFVGEGALDGRIVDFAAVGVPGGAAVSWVHERAPDSEHLLALAVNGDLLAVMTAGETSYEVAGLEDGAYRFEVIPFRPNVRKIPDLHGRPYGKRAYLTWPASGSPDCVGYKVYWNEGSGVADTLLDTVEGVAVHPKFLEGATAGSGSGRVSIGGTWGGTDTNEEFTLRIEPDGGFSHNLAGSFSASRPFAAGGVYLLDFGVTVVFEDDPSEYDVDDEFIFRIGPPVAFVSKELLEGSFSFTIAAIDAADNESGKLTEKTMVIVHRPGEVINAEVVWDGVEVTLSWTLPGDVDLAAVLIFSNFSNTFGILRDRLIETGAWVTKAAAATSHSFTPTVSGIWKFRILTKDTAGRVSESAVLLSVDTSGPKTTVEIANPEMVEVAPSAGGTFKLRWQYDWNSGKDCTEFRIYSNSDFSTPVFVTPDVVQPAVTSTGLLEYTWTSSAYPGTRYFTVRASNGVDETINTDLTEGVPDATAPSLTGSISGAAT